MFLGCEVQLDAHRNASCLSNADLNSSNRLDYDSVILGEMLAVFYRKMWSKLTEYNTDHAQIVLASSDHGNIHHVEENVTNLVKIVVQHLA